MPSNLNPHDLHTKPSPLPVAVQWSLVAVLVAGLVVSVVFSLSDHWRRATFILGVSMMWLAVIRLVCDSRILGVLSVRSRRMDVLFTTGVGALLAYLAYSVDSLGS
ncbi:DUF3017 domain-containing protein [Corynebacterium sp. CCM 8862]|uniref:DUF3017 domain-containing protein n=1 Tax=Corynebacterium mendelii TaxID=2765362 RepID=A0A939DZF3_9CORY|nr:DUF3017 domain-containing protein [Corynebacterium mendelii]